MGFKKDDPGAIPKSSFNSSLVFTPCPLFGVQFTNEISFLLSKIPLFYSGSNLVIWRKDGDSNPGDL